MTPARRRVLVAGYVATGSWCWVLYSYGAVLQLLRAEHGTVRAITGAHSLGLAGGSVVTGGQLPADSARLAVAWFVTAPAPALAGLLVVGLGIGGQYPLGVGLVLEAAPGAEDRTAGAMSVQTRPRSPEGRAGRAGTFSGPPGYPAHIMRPAWRPRSGARCRRPAPRRPCPG